MGGGGTQEVLEARKNELKAAIERCTSDFDRPKLEERLAKLSGGVAVVKVGGATEAEMKERFRWYETQSMPRELRLRTGLCLGAGRR